MLARLAEEPASTGLAAPALDRPRRRVSVWNRFVRHRLAMAGATVLLILALSAVFAPLIARSDPYVIDLSSYRAGPSAAHWLGTDSAGRDVFSRLLYAGRVSLTVGLVSVAIYCVIGVLLGALAGFYGSWIDTTMMRLADIFLSFPSLIIIITLAAVFGPSVTNLILAIGVLGWPPIAR